MNATIKNALIFAVGAAIGSAVTYKIVKTKYEQIAQEEIDSVKEVYARREEHIKKIEELEKLKEDLIEAEKEDNENDKEVTNYASIIKEEQYIQKEEGVELDKPYVITPDEFSEFDDYETVSLTYYSDKVLTDEYDNVIDDVDNIVGYDSLETFGQYEDDSVFVRNDRLMTDYEILLDLDKFYERGVD